jgi:hypothetical protein
MTSAAAKKAWETRRARMGIVDPNSEQAVASFAAKLRRDLSETGLAALASLIGAKQSAIAPVAAATVPQAQRHRKPRLVVQPTIVDYPMPNTIDRHSARGPSIWATFADGEIVRMTFATTRGKPVNVGRGLRVAISAYRTRRWVLMRAGYREWNRTASLPPVPEFKKIFIVRDFAAAEIDYTTVSADAANVHTAALRRGETTKDAQRLTRELNFADRRALDAEISRLSCMESDNQSRHDPAMPASTEIPPHAMTLFASAAPKSCHEGAN